MKQQRQNDDIINIQAGLKFTSQCSYIGLICFCVVGLVATQIMLLPEIVVTWTVVIGALFVAIGSEMGSYYSIVASFERHGTLKGWDNIGAFISQLATGSSVLLAFVTLSGSLDNWVYEFINKYGYALTTLFVSLDATFNYAAMGIYRFHLREIQLEQQRKYLEFQRENIKIQQELAKIKREEFALEAQKQLFLEERETGPMEPVVVQNTTTEQPLQLSSETAQQAQVVVKQTRKPVVVGSQPTSNKKSAIVQLLGDHRSNKEIAEIVGCSAEYVRQVKLES